MNDTPAPRRRPPPRFVHASPPVVPIPDGPVASLACWCGFRDEIKGATLPDRLDCPECRTLDGLRRYAPRYPPPATAGRELTALELEQIRIDKR